MKEKYLNKEDIKKLNTSVEIYRRLQRSSVISFCAELHAEQVSSEDVNFTVLLLKILSYVNDDINYALRETKKLGLYDCFMKNNEH
ncbi:TPA: hypothetical protein ACXZXJ_000118 [Salmonella enterica]